MHRSLDYPTEEALERITDASHAGAAPTAPNTYACEVPTTAVLGPGGVGGFVAAALARAHQDVTVISRESTARRIAADGISVHSVFLGDFVGRPHAVETLAEPADVLIVAPKATSLADALQRVNSECRLVVPLLNGLDHMATLRARFGAKHVVAGTIRIESDRPAPGRIMQTSPTVRIELASDRPELGPQLDELVGLLDRAGIPASVGRSEAQVLWSKFVRLNALACTTSASDQPIGFIRTDPVWRPILLACIEETAAVANADGAEIDPRATLSELEIAHPELGSSLGRDIAAGREPELDPIAGSVIRAAERHGIDCPTTQRLSGLIADRISADAQRR
jgi:2-dehydropantoate 2-reductase